MAWVFSKRCKQALKDKKIKVSIPLSVRIRILKAMRKHGMYAEDELSERIKEEIGCENLLSFPFGEEGQAFSSDLGGFILRGLSPHLFDALELSYDIISEENKTPFQHSFNQIMEESSLPWRMADGKIFPVDSAYIEEEIIRRSYKLLHEAKFQGALQEFEKARADLSNCDYEGAIQNANLAVESVIKEILGIEKEKPGVLFRKLIGSGIIPEYYNGFLKAFEENILRCVAIMRNEEPSVGHGRGPQDCLVPSSLAELGVHLSAVIINFLIKQHLDAIGKESEKVEITNEGDIPF